VPEYFGLSLAGWIAQKGRAGILSPARRAARALRFWGCCLATLAASLHLLVLQLGAGALTSLNIRIVDGEGQKYAMGSRATRGVSVEITDDSGKPVEGATVTFLLPEQGPGGVFANGTKIEVTSSRADGTAQVWGMQWNHTPGSFEIRIVAAKEDVHAGTVCPLSLADFGDTQAANAVSAKHSGHKWLWIALGAGAAAGAGLAARSFVSSPPQVVNTVKIGAPTVSIGPQQ
jgi:hypothetical protein